MLSIFTTEKQVAEKMCDVQESTPNQTKIFETIWCDRYNEIFKLKEGSHYNFLKVYGGKLCVLLSACRSFI